jgi:hypothetical protein
MPKQTQWLFVAGTTDDIRDRVSEVITGAAAEGFGEIQHVSHSLALVGGSAPLLSLVIVVGESED